MATIPGALLLCASSPYARKGVLWESYHRYFGQDGPILVWNAPTRTMNPTVPQSFIDAEMEKDPASAAAEYLAEFRTDIEAYVSREALEAVVEWGVSERGPLRRQALRRLCRSLRRLRRHHDAWRSAHKEGELAVLDCSARSGRRSRPEDVVTEFATCSSATRSPRSAATVTLASGRASSSPSTASSTSRARTPRARSISTCCRW